MKYYSLSFLTFIFFISCSVFKSKDSLTKSEVATKYANTITAEELKEHLTILASDEYEGRETGETGQKLAGDYIKNEFIKDGLQPGNNGSYFQYFPLKETSKPKAYFKINDIKYDFTKDFYFYDSYSDFSSFYLLSSDIVSVGKGISENDREDYIDLKIKGKTVIINADKDKDFPTWDWKKKLKVAINNGASMVMFTSSDFNSKLEKLSHYLNKSSLKLILDEENRKEKKQIPIFFISDKLHSKIISNSTKEITFTYKSTNRKLTSSNVLGFIEGSDSKLKKEIVILTAHYDHLGIKNGKVYNGADDDGSGTVALLEIAEAFQKAKNDGNGPKRSILIMPVSGEEKGLLGSKYYSEKPVFPIKNTVVDLNIDMIGRIDTNHSNENYVYLIGGDKISNELHVLSEVVNNTYTQLELDYRYNAEDDPNRFYYRSDHYNFADKGIPVIFYFSGVHEDYHQETDEVDKILFNKVEHITKLVFYTAWEIANKKNRLIIDKK